MDRPYLQLWKQYLSEQADKIDPRIQDPSKPIEIKPIEVKPITMQPAKPAAPTSQPAPNTPTSQTQPTTNAPAVQVRWKDLSKQGYQTAPGSKSLENSTTLHDANIVATGAFDSKAQQAVMQMLKDRKIFDWQSKGQIVIRRLPNGTSEARYVSNTPL